MLVYFYFRLLLLWEFKFYELYAVYYCSLSIQHNTWNIVATQQRCVEWKHLENHSTISPYCSIFRRKQTFLAVSGLFWWQVTEAHLSLTKMEIYCVDIGFSQEAGGQRYRCVLRKNWGNIGSPDILLYSQANVSLPQFHGFWQKTHDFWVRDKKQYILRTNS